MALEAGCRAVRTRYKLVRNGVACGMLEAAGNATLSMTQDAEVKLALSGAFRANPLFEPLQDRVRPILELDGVHYPLGLYVVTACAGEYARGAKSMRLECTDEGIILKDNKTTEHIMLAKGNRYTDIVQAILIQNGLANILCEDSDERLQTNREDWETGTPYLTIANALLAEINYNSLWFDFDGFARIERCRQQGPETLLQSHVYRSGAVSILKSDCSLENDLLAKPNVFVATVSNPDYPQPLRARAVNDNPESPISTVARGRQLVAVYKPDNIASQAELQSFVENERYKSLISTESVTIQTALNPVHLVGDTFAVEHESLHGLFMETSWSMDLGAGGAMTHTGKRVMHVD